METTVGIQFAVVVVVAVGFVTVELFVEFMIEVCRTDRVVIFAVAVRAPVGKTGAICGVTGGSFLQTWDAEWQPFSLGRRIGKRVQTVLNGTSTMEHAEVGVAMRIVATGAAQCR